MEKEWAVQDAYGLFPTHRMMLGLHANLIARDHELQNFLKIATDQAEQNYAAADFHNPNIPIPDAVASFGRLGRGDPQGSIRLAIDAEQVATAFVDHANWVEGIVETQPNRLVEGAVYSDADQLRIGRQLFRTPLWPTQPPDWFTQADRETRAIWAKDPETWAFWEKWWDGVIGGDMPFPPALLREVAMIEDEVWQAGPRAVAAAIAKIEKIHDLRAQLEVLTGAMDKEELSPTQGGATLARPGHNNPPEAIEAVEVVTSSAVEVVTSSAKEIVTASAVEIAQALNAAREELAMPAPEPSRLRAIGAGILAAIGKAAEYSGRLADTFLHAFAGEMGKQAATVVAWLIKGGIGIMLLTTFAKDMIAVWPI